MTSSRKVCVYVFSVHDPRPPHQRLELAVKDFCLTCSLPIPSEEAMETARTNTGKPYFPYMPHLHFSISHSGNYWSCAVADQIIGYDLQEREQPVDETYDAMLTRHKKMASRFFHPAEAEFISLDCRYNFLTVWTAREAYVKHTGQGIDQYFSEHCVVPDAKNEIYRVSGNTENICWSAMDKCFWKTNYKNAYTMCICTEFPCEYIILSL